MMRGWIAIVITGATALAGCQGDRWSSVVDQATPEGRWRPDGVLIRSYNVTLDQAADAVLALAQGEGWLIISERRGERSAHVNAKTRQLVAIDFSVWAPVDRATEIGIEYGGGNRAGSILMFEDLERLLPGKRITVNQPE